VLFQNAKVGTLLSTTQRFGRRSPKSFIQAAQGRGFFLYGRTSFGVKRWPLNGVLTGDDLAGGKKTI